MDEIAERSNRAGALGLPFSEVGEVAQAIASCLIDRGYMRDQIVSRLRDEDNFEEVEWWEAQGGKIVDNFADFLDLTAFPEEDDVRVKPMDGLGMGVIARSIGLYR